MLARGRVIRGGSPLVVERPPADRVGRILSEREATALTRAEAILTSAREEARRMALSAKEAARRARDEAEADGTAKGIAALAVGWVQLRQREVQAEDLALDRIVTAATALAERLLGRALRQDPQASVDLARQVLAEARSAERVALHAHPEDAPHLEAAMALDESRVRVVPDPTLERGDIRLETPAGTIEARLGPSLALLSTELREALGR